MPAPAPLPTRRRLVGTDAWPSPGDLVKVYLPGEAPWAECLAAHREKGFWVGCLDNHLTATEDHGLAFGDLVVFVPYPAFTRCPWVPHHLKDEVEP